MSEFDGPWKDVLDAYFEQFMQLFLPQAHAEIDWSRPFESLDKELQQIAPEGELAERVVDKLFKVWLKDGQEQWLLIHIEVQTTRETGFPRRIYIYNYRSYDKYNREVVSIAVLGDDNPNGRPTTFGYARWGFETTTKFPVIKLLDHAARRSSLEASPNLFAPFVLAHLDTLATKEDDRERKNRKLQLYRNLILRGQSSEKIRQLFDAIDRMMELPKNLAIEYWKDVKQFHEESKMPYVSSAELYGRAEGRKEGRQEGRQEGLIRGIEVVLRMRFPQEGVRLLSEIRQINDSEKLQSILDAVETAKSPEELRNLWAD